MDEGIVRGKPLRRRRIIERPRLTRLLDDSPARIKMLIAPAGYGKTTLARQWLAEADVPPHWCLLSDVHRDLVRLVGDLAISLRPLLRDPDETEPTLRVAAERGASPDDLARLLVGAIAANDQLLVIEDYHHVVAAPQSDAFLARTVQQAPMRVLLTSRLRPEWATARTLLYGDVFAIDRAALALDAYETASVAGGRSGAALGRLVEMTRGWPAAVALAAVVDAGYPERLLPDALHGFLADEIFNCLAEVERDGVLRLAVASCTSVRLAEELLGTDEATRIIATAEAVGFVDLRPHGSLELHPLVSSFLVRKARELPESELDAVASAVSETLVRRRDWDATFDLVRTLRRPRLLDRLIGEGAWEQLDLGRVESVRAWVDFGRECGYESPYLDLARAEVLSRSGHVGAAKILAVAAAVQLDAEDSLVSRAYTVAGRAAHVASEEEDARGYFKKAAALARHARDRRAAAMGALACAVDLELDEAHDLLAQLTEAPPGDVAEFVALAGRRLNFEFRFGRTHDLTCGRVAHDLLESVADPLVRTSFRNVFAYVLAVTGDYNGARRVAADLEEDAAQSLLRFALPYAWTTKGIACAGLRDYQEAYVAFAEAEELASALNDGFAIANARAARGRALVSESRFAEAADATLRPDARMTRAMEGELLATRGIAVVCAGDIDHGAELIAGARATTRAAEARVLAASAEAIATQMGGSADARGAATAALDVALATGNVDCYVAAVRAFPELAAAAAVGEDAARIRQVLLRAGDVPLLDRLGLAERDRPAALQRLSPREREILLYVAQGLPNAAIARALVISPATVKLHVHHIFEKLGVRSRTAAAMRGAALLRDQADAAARSET